MKKIFSKLIVIGLLVMFVITLLVMIIFPYKNLIMTYWYNLKSVWNGQVVYSMQFQFLVQTIIPYDQVMNVEWQDIIPIENMPSIESYTNTLERNNTNLKIPAVNISGNIVTGKSPKEMDRGFWHYPNSGLPGTKKNTVIFGHRFFNIPPATDTFYDLDKVTPGQQIYLNSELGDWTFVVTVKKIINKYDTSILNQPDQGSLILITCHPLWTSEQRLVIIAKPKSKGVYI